MNQTEIPPPIQTSPSMSFYVQEKYRLYETSSKFYLIGADRDKKLFRVLKFDRLELSDLHVDEDPVLYSSKEIDDLLQCISDGNKVTGGMTFVTKAYGIAGCVKFLESYYLILITKRKQVGFLCGHAIYSIVESRTITIPHASVQSELAHSKNEWRYKKLLSNIDLTREFFYSHTYPIMQSLQTNVMSRTGGMPYDNIFVWNDYLTQSIRSRCNENMWTVALVHGYFEQARVSIYGKDLSITLISRRSRYFAGTRYLKRGVNDLGRVANDVETEQIVLDEEAGTYMGKMSSVVQMRGSVPLFWSQETSKFSPKPDIIVQRNDPMYEATRLHFKDLSERYGNPITILNLIKTFEKRPREMILRRGYHSAVEYLNSILPKEKQLKYIHWDFHKFSKKKDANKYENLLAVLRVVAKDTIDKTGIYYSGKPINIRKMGNDWITFDSDSACFQNGVLRTNCIDCLDRTNIAQFAIGLQALGSQLKAMGLTDDSCVDSDSTIAEALMEMYRSMGDALAEQYGGSAAHNTVFPEQPGMWKATTKPRELLKSLKRYYSNTYKDGEKQDAINLFLGYFQPQEGKPALWELESDYHLHVSGVMDEEKMLDKCSELYFFPDAPLRPLPACREDFLRIKLTSFDKLIERTCSAIKDVRLFNELDQALDNGSKSSIVTPDAIEIQIKSSERLSRRSSIQECVPVRQPFSHHEDDSEKSQDGNEEDDGFYNLDWLSSCSGMNEEENLERYQEMDLVNDENENYGWYGGLLFSDLDESSEIYKHYAELCHIPNIEPFKTNPEIEQHYAELCHIPNIEPFKTNPEIEQHYADVLRMSSFDVLQHDDAAVAAEMEEALKQYNHIGEDLGIFPRSCNFPADDPIWLTQWLLTRKEKEPTRRSVSV